MSLFVRLLLILATLGFSGCVTSPVASERQSTMIDAAYSAVDSLIAGQNISPMATPGGGTRVLVATVTDLNKLNQSTAFGRLLAEQMSSRLSQTGIPVGELKLTGKLYVSQSQGELVLSRELKEISSNQKADLVLAGTYVDAGSSVFVSLKLVRASDSTVSNAYNFAMKKSNFVATLMAR